jgi:AraC family transcriptional regulator, positive regulator of tynA and feaB
MGPMMLQSDGIAGASLQDFDAWRDLVERLCGGYRSEGIAPKAFHGWVRPLNVYGLTARDIGSNAYRVGRTERDIRLDGLDHYLALLQLSGKSAIIQNDQAVRLVAGDIALVDAARPVTFLGEAGVHWMSLRLPRQALVSHLGFEPRGGSFRPRGSRTGRLLSDVVAAALEEGESALSPADSYMQFAAYDLIGALFSPSDPLPVTRPTDKLFARICGMIRSGFSDPDFGPAEVAAAAGISLRYLQKLFTERGSTCNQFIYSLRLDHAAHLLRRRASLDSGQPLSEIAYGCGFRDYGHFARKFRRRIGCAPGAYSGAGARPRGLTPCVLVLAKGRSRPATFSLRQPSYNLRLAD